MRSEDDGEAPPAQRQRTTPRTETRQHPVRPPEAAAEACWADVPPEVDAPAACSADVSEAAAILSGAAGGNKPSAAREADVAVQLVRRVEASAAAELAELRTLPEGFATLRCHAWDDPRLRGLMELFASEDSRIGLPEPGEVADTQRVDLLLHRGEAVGYAWSEEGSVRFPPRLHHLFLLPAYRRSEARLGARFLAWWRDECALKIHAFGVTRPNERMQRLLRATGCVEMNRRYGFDEATELFHARAPDRADR